MFQRQNHRKFTCPSLLCSLVILKHFRLVSFCLIRLLPRSMSARPRYHTRNRRAQERGEDIRAAARTIIQLLGVENHHSGWRDANWQRPPRRRDWRYEPGRFVRPPPRTFQRTPPQRYRRPYFREDLRPGNDLQHPQRSSLPDRSRVRPRRGPPVAAVLVPGGMTRGGGRGSLVG